ncbi:hypothetical protein [Allosphingosinicella sp.]|uniref:hypothetical protein n=1 Tax=Allosphingosinicella sp. TaxID=2823234 RepID=UPI002FC1912B
MDYHYSLRVSDPKSRWDHGAYSALATFSFSDDLIRPENSKYLKVSVTLSARAGMLEEQPGLGTLSLGTLSVGGDEFSAYVFVPAKRLAEIATFAQSGKVQIVHLVGTKLRYRSGLVCNIARHTSLEEEEW